MEKNDSGLMFAGGAVVIIIVFAACLKALKALFIELTQVADAFSKLMASFLMGLWSFAQMAFLVGLGVGSVIAAVYFTYRYVKMVREGTALREQMRLKVSEMEAKFDSDFAAFENHVRGQVQKLEERLSEALRKPDVVPLPTSHESEAVTGDTAMSESEVDDQVTTEVPIDELTDVNDDETEEIESEVNAGAIASPY
jgi:hypothetical protein